jgi:hypothetical protein
MTFSAHHVPVQINLMEIPIMILRRASTNTAPCDTACRMIPSVAGRIIVREHGNDGTQAV